MELRLPTERILSRKFMDGIIQNVDFAMRAGELPSFLLRVNSYKGDTLTMPYVNSKMGYLGRMEVLWIQNSLLRSNVSLHSASGRMSFSENEMVYSSQDKSLISRASR